VELQERQDKYAEQLYEEARTWQPGDQTSFLMFTATDPHLSTRGYIAPEICRQVQSILQFRGISSAEVAKVHRGY